jgi:hypothetical protein
MLTVVTDAPSIEGRRGWQLLLVLSALHALAVLSAPLLPTTDGPAHAWNAALLAHWGDPDWSSITAWFQLDARPVPNWTGHLLLAALQTLLSPELADRVLLAGYTLALPLVAGRALDALRPGAAVWAVLVLPLLHGVPFHMGFLNFCLGTVLWWTMLGAWWRGRERPAVRRTLVLAAWGAALYFTHGLVWLAAFGALGLLAGWRLLVERCGSRDLLVIAAAAAPTALLAALFAGGGGGLVWVLRAGARARHLVRLETLVSIHPAEAWLALAVGAVLLAALAAGLVTTRTRPVGRSDGPLVLAGVVLLAYFVAPDGIAGATFIHVRAMLFLLFALVAAVAARAPEGRLRLGLITAVVLLSLTLLGVRATRWRAVGGAVAERVAVLDRLTDDGVVLHVMASRIEHPWPEQTFGWRIRPLAHLVGWAAAKRPLRALPNYEASSGHFPLRWAAGRDPRPELNGWLLAPPYLDLAAWEARGDEVGHVLVSGTPGEPGWQPIGLYLDAHFAPVERGHEWVLYRRRGP